MVDGIDGAGRARPRVLLATMAVAVVVVAAGCQLPPPPVVWPTGDATSGPTLTPVVGDWTRPSRADLTAVRATSIAVSGSTVYLGDSRGQLIASGGGVIRAVDTTNGTQRIVAGTRVLAAAEGDGLPARGTPIGDIGPMAIDGAGRLLLAADGMLKRLEADGRIVTIAGWLPSGGAEHGDGGPAAGASFVDINGLAVDPAGRIAIADDDRLRVIDLDGTIRTIAGGGTVTPVDGIAGSVAAFTLFGSISVSAAGEFVLPEVHRHRVWAVRPDGQVRLVAGSGTPGFAGDGGPATVAAISHPNSVATGADGSILIADMGNNRIRSVSPTGSITTVAGRGSAGATASGADALATDIVGPWAIAALADGRVAIVDGSNQLATPTSTGWGNAWIMDVGGAIHRLAGTGSNVVADHVAAIDASIGLPTGMARDRRGNRYVADAAFGRIYRLDPVGLIATFIGASNTDAPRQGLPPELNTIGEIAVDRDDNLLVTDLANGLVRRYDPDGHRLADLPTTVGGHRLSLPFALAVDGAGNVFVGQPDLVIKVATDGTTSIVAGTTDRDAPTVPGGAPAQGSATASRIALTDLTVTPSGDLYLIDHGLLRRVRDGRFEDLGVSCCADPPPDDPATTFTAIRSGSDGRIWAVAGRSLHRVEVGRPSELIVRFLPHRTSAVPRFDNLFIADVLPLPDGTVELAAFGDGQVYRVTGIPA